jgi:CubicO group peptidase (beta-lactamase class C family)
MRLPSLWNSLAVASSGALCALLVGWSPADVANKAPDQNKVLADLLEPIRARHKLPALGAAVVNSKGLIAVAVVGVRKQGAAPKATVNDLFHLGSDTKAITALLIARLIEEGLLSYDLRLDRAFPELAKEMPAELKGVTLAHLLTHRAGLAANPKGGWARFFFKGSVRQQREAAVREALLSKPQAEPGKKLVYSNVGYVVAGHLAERATKTAWEDLLRARVFKPLGMSSAGFGAPARTGAVEQPWPHSADGSPVAWWRPGDNPQVLGPAGTVRCSLPDWARFAAEALAGAQGKKRAGGLLRPASSQKLSTSPFGDPFYTLGGWGGAPKSPQGLVLAHDGSNTMNYASALLLPKRDLAILVVTNQGGELGRKGAHAVRQAVGRRFVK